MVYHVYFNFICGAISDKILRSGQSRFVSRGLIAIVGFIVFAVSIFFAVHENLYVTIFWLSLGLGGMGVSMGMSWGANDIRNFAGTVSGWMNLWGNIGALLSPFLGWCVGCITWLDNDFPIINYSGSHRAILWLFVSPDKPLIKMKVVN